VGPAADEATAAAAAAAAAAGGGGDAADAAAPDAAGGGGGLGDRSGGIFAPLLPPLQPHAAAGPAGPWPAGGVAAATPGASARGTPEPSAAAAARSRSPEAASAAAGAFGGGGGGGNMDAYMLLGVERFRVPEVLLQPPLAGVDEAGLPELVEWCLNRLAPGERAACIAGGLLLLGGSAGFPGAPAPHVAAQGGWVLSPPAPSGVHGPALTAPPLRRACTPSQAWAPGSRLS
jgi:hypothetical protein